MKEPWLNSSVISMGTPREGSSWQYYWSSFTTRMAWAFLPAATKLDLGNVFTGVCDSVHRGGGETPQENPPGRENPPSRETPQENPPGQGEPPPQQGDPPPEKKNFFWFFFLIFFFNFFFWFVFKKNFLDFLFWFWFFIFLGISPPNPPLPHTEADSGMWSTSGRYASYWNAFLLKAFLEIYHKKAIMGFFQILDYYGYSLHFPQPLLTWWLTDRHNWKQYLHTTSLTSGNKLFVRAHYKVYFP